MYLTVFPHLPTLLSASLALVFPLEISIATYTSTIKSFRPLAFALSRPKLDNLKTSPVDALLQLGPLLLLIFLPHLSLFSYSLYFLQWISRGQLQHLYRKNIRSMICLERETRRHALIRICIIAFCFYLVCISWIQENKVSEDTFIITLIEKQFLVHIYYYYYYYLNFICIQDRYCGELNFIPPKPPLGCTTLDSTNICDLFRFSFCNNEPLKIQ